MLAQRADPRGGVLAARSRPAARRVGPARPGADRDLRAVDIVPTRIDVKVGDVAASDILAPRALTYTSAIQTQEARDAARVAVAPQYDFTPDKASAVARQQGLAFDRIVAPVDTAFDAAVAESERLTLLEIGPARSVGRGPGDAPRAATLRAGRPSATRAPGSSTSSSRPSFATPTWPRSAPACRGGSSVASTRPSGSCRPRSSPPLLVANSDYDQTETDAGSRTSRRDRGRRSSSPSARTRRSSARATRSPPWRSSRSRPSGSATARWDIARLAGWALFSVLLVGLLLTWVWRFRPELWHRYERADPHRDAPALLDVRARGHRRPIRAAVHPADGRRRHPGRTPARLGHGHRPDGGRSRSSPGPSTAARSR